MPEPETYCGFRHSFRKVAGIGMLAWGLIGCSAAPTGQLTSPDAGSGANGQTVPSETSSGAVATKDGDQQSAASASGGLPSAHETETVSGHFLAARQALYLSDVRRSAEFFLKAIDGDAPDVALLRQAFLTQYYYGDIEKAAAIGRQLERLNLSMSLAGEPGTALAIRNKDWAATLVLADVIAEDTAAQDIAGVITAWAHAANGQGDAGISQLIETGRMAGSDNDALPDYIQLNIALMAEYLGHREEAQRRADNLQRLDLSAGLAIQLAGFFIRDGDLQAADTLLGKRLSDQFNRHSTMEMLIEQPQRGTDIDSLIASSIIEAALAAQNETAQRSLSARLRLALFIAPELEFGHLLLAQQLSDFGQFDEAIIHLDKIAVDGLFGQPAQLLKASIFESLGNTERSISILKAAVTADRDNAYLYQRIGDSYRRARNFTQSRDSYMKALALGNNTGLLHRNLGMALEQLGEDLAAEGHLLRALELNSSDAYALNYLGYWWADEGRNLEQAIGLIERAVEERPGSGFFVDSLGWVHFKLGDPQKAVGYLERATELEPSDPEITGHLGDVYWVLGRYDEARFKWRLALSLSADEEERAMLSARLKDGLAAKDVPAAN
jgi:tetratricopeptide (TPR) repeat protein